jgi:hypothetical protein
MSRSKQHAGGDVALACSQFLVVDECFATKGSYGFILWLVSCKKLLNSLERVYSSSDHETIVCFL